VSSVRSRGPIVNDPDVFERGSRPGSRLAERYAPVITGRLAFISFQTAAEPRYGATRRGWGKPWMRGMEATIERVEVAHSGPELVAVYAQLRAGCVAAGHALGQREHTGDRWIAATAIRLGIPLSRATESLAGAPKLQLKTLAPAQWAASKVSDVLVGTRARLRRGGGALPGKQKDPALQDL
jgi:predicted nucleic acid-binding protein